MILANEFIAMDVKRNIFVSSEQRGDDRWSHYASCVVSVNGRMTRLRDLSSGGAGIEGSNRYQVGDSVLIELPWRKMVRGSIVGLGFDLAHVKFDFAVEEPI